MPLGPEEDETGAGREGWYSGPGVKSWKPDEGSRLEGSNQFIGLISQVTVAQKQEDMHR